MNDELSRRAISLSSVSTDYAAHDEAERILSTKGTNLSLGKPIPGGVYDTEQHSKSFDLRLRYQCREVFSLALTHFSYS
jgi:hypothetical protein